jgi:hypothetical protein
MSTIVTRAGKGSALTWTEGDANINNLNNDKIELTDLSVGAEGTASGDGSIAYDNATGVFTYTPPVIPAAGISNVVEDTTPQLGGALDVNGNSIVSTSNGNITLAPNGSGNVHADSMLLRVGTGSLFGGVTSNGAHDLILNTNSGTNSGSIVITDGVNGNITIFPNGTGGTVVTNLEYQEFVHSLGTTSGTIAPNAANGNIQTITLNGNLTINAFTSPVSGQTITLIITTGGTGRTLTSTMKFAGGSKTLSTTNTIDILTISYIGTTYYASLVKDYK